MFSLILIVGILSIQPSIEGLPHVKLPRELVALSLPTLMNTVSASHLVDSKRSYRKESGIISSLFTIFSWFGIELECRAIS